MLGKIELQGAIRHEKEVQQSAEKAVRIRVRSPIMAVCLCLMQLGTGIPMWLYVELHWSALLHAYASPIN